MFHNLTGIVGRKGSSDRYHPSGRNEHGRQHSGSGNISSSYDRIRHPQHIYASSGGPELAASPPPEGSSRILRQDSGGSISSVTGQGSMQRPPAQLPEEMRASQRQKQLERERERERLRERERQSGTPSTGSPHEQDQMPAKYSSNHMESSVTRLLVATKMLLESLTKWSLGERSETQVSDIYVRLGNDFNSARVAFGSYGIDMTDLASVPDDLRTCLERCLSEDASPAVLEVHLPRIREIIINLLQGLKLKQAQYKQFLVQKRASGRDSISVSPAAVSRRSKGASSRTERLGVSEGGQAPEVEAANRPESLQRASSAGAPGSHSRSSATVEPLAASSTLPTWASLTRPNARTSKVIGEPASQVNVTDVPEGMARRTSRKGANGSSPLKQAVALPEGQEEDVSQTLDDGESQAPADMPRHSLVDPGPKPPASPSAEDEPKEEMADAVEMTEDKLNGGVRPQRSSGRARHTSKASLEVTDMVDADPSMKALKNRDALERRASKRFSAYTFNKMGVGQSFGQGFGSGSLGMLSSTSGKLNSPLLDRRGGEHRSSGSKRIVRPPLPESSPSSENASPSGVPRSADYFSAQGSGGRTPKARAGADKFDAIEEVKTPTSPAGPESLPSPVEAAPPVRRRSAARSPRGNKALLATGYPAVGRISQAISSTDSLPYVDAMAPPSETGEAPPPPTAEERARLDAMQNKAVPAQAHVSLSPGVLNIYVQLGRQTRKAALDLDETNTVTRGITIARLRMLFVDRFAYSPGMDDFPAIYIKDPASGVSYELEDLNDLQEGCLLTLNIEPLDQVKQHLDLSLGAITREIRELKATMAEKDRDARRISHSFVADNTIHATPTKITDSAFQAAGNRVAQLKRASSRASAGDDATGALKVQYDELQSLRREFAVLRQLQTDFDTDVKGILGGIREQASKVRQIASAEVPAERNFIIAGKAKLDGGSQEVLTLVEDLQDTVDDLKQDVIQRGVKPKPALVKQITSDIEKATKGLLELEKYVQTVKPSWKKTWETELQNIVDEQEFLNHQEGLIADLRDDHQALQEVFANIQQVVKLRGSGRSGGKYIPPLPEEGHEGLSTVMMEVKSQAVNHEKRLRALQAVERQRQKDIESRSDEFADELAGFVDGKALRKTGGHVEAERVRQKRDNATFKAMFGGGGSGGAPAAGVASLKPKKLILGPASSETGSTETLLSSESSQSIGAS